jgi:hypothetical protein
VLARKRERGDSVTRQRSPSMSSDRVIHLNNCSGIHPTRVPIGIERRRLRWHGDPNAVAMTFSDEQWRASLDLGRQFASVSAIPDVCDRCVDQPVPRRIAGIPWYHHRLA